MIMIIYFLLKESHKANYGDTRNSISFCILGDLFLERKNSNLRDCKYGTYVRKMENLFLGLHSFVRRISYFKSRVDLIEPID